MSPRGLLRLCCLLLGVSWVTGFAAGATRRSSHRKFCGDVAYDRREAACCGRRLHRGAGLRCCGKLPFNPFTATCCRTGSGQTIKAKVTQGVSSKASDCCGLKAFSRLSELCCSFNIVAKPVPKAQCCDKAAFDARTQLCCGPMNSRTVLPRISVYHQCCGENAFDNTTHCCCERNHSLHIHPLSSECCQKEQAPRGRLADKILKRKRRCSQEWCGHKKFNGTTHLCCGPSGNKTILQRRSIDHQCCGTDQYNTRTHCCCDNVTELVIELHGSSCCLNQSDRNETATRKKRSVEQPQPRCNQETFNENTHLCCGPSGNKELLQRTSIDHQCCGTDQYNNRTHCCCDRNDSLVIEPRGSSCCLNQPAPPEFQKETCDEGTFSETTHLCCGPSGNKELLQRTSIDHQCCGTDQYNTRTHCCCDRNDALVIEPRGSSCCLNQPGVQAQQPHPPSSMSGTLHKDPSSHTHCCCKRKQRKLLFTLGQCDAAPSVSKPCTHVCCGGCESEWKPGNDQCCGNKLHGSVQHEALCCGDTLPVDLKEGEECAEPGFNPHDPEPPGQHCCGTELLLPNIEICCSGRRHERAENVYCCGVNAYNVRDPRWKCCSGVLHNVSSLAATGQEPQCCGSSLLLPQSQSVCCSDERWQLVHAARPGFRCCGSEYYDTSFFKCCAGKVHSMNSIEQHEGIKESQLLAVNNLNRRELCEGLHVGVVQSVSLHSVVFHSVLTIHGGSGSVTVVPLPHVFPISHRCDFPRLVPGSTYFFNHANVYADFSRCSVLQSLHFIYSKCRST